MAREALSRAEREGALMAWCRASGTRRFDWLLGWSENPPVRASPYLAFVPWLLFGLVSRSDSLQAATIVALAAAIVVSLPSIMRRRVKVLEIASIAAFAAFVIVAFATNPGPNSVLERYARAFAAGTLALIAFGSLLVIPFTEQYARESVPQQFWSSARFKRINRVLTFAWGMIFAAIAASHAIAGAIDTRRAQTIFNWVVPIGLLVFGLKHMESYRAREAAHPGEGESSAPAAGSQADTVSGEVLRHR